MKKKRRTRTAALCPGRPLARGMRPGEGTPAGRAGLLLLLLVCALLIGSAHPWAGIRRESSPRLRSARAAVESAAGMETPSGEPDAEKYARVQTWEEVYAALVQAGRDRWERLTLVWHGDLDLGKDQERLHQLVYSAGVRSFSWSFDGRAVTLDGIRYCDCFAICLTREEAAVFLSECAEKRIVEFRLCFSPELASELFADGQQELRRLLAGSQLLDPYQYEYSAQSGWVEFTGAEYAASAAPTSPLAEFLAAFGAHTDKLEASFKIPVSDEVKKLLMEKDGIGSDQYPLLTDICSNHGIYRYGFHWSGNTLYMNSIKYYEGKNILYAYRNGQISSLEPRERATLAEALWIVSLARGTTLEKERAIHDALCEHITYTTVDGPHSDNDCAVGALLNRQADCDGYSDAFYLCCNLAGIPALHQQGDIFLQEEDDPDELDGTHMWNLVNIDGTWVSTDVTWDDDDEEGTFYVYYNIGSRQLEETHFWKSPALSVAMEENSLNTLRDPDIVWHCVSDWDDLYSLLKDLAPLRPERICLRTSPEMNVWTNYSRFSQAVHSAAVTDYSWYPTHTAVELAGIEYPPVFRICSEETELLEFIEDCARSDVSKYRIYFSPEMAKKLFAADQRDLATLLAQTRLKNPFGFAASETTGMIVFKNAEYVDRAASLVPVRSWDEVYAALAANSADRADRLALSWPGSDELKENSGQLNTLVVSTGVKDFSWTFRKNLVFLYDLQYYTDFSLCSTETEVAAWLRECASRRDSEIRIYCSDREVYDALRLNGSARFFSLLEEAGCRNTTISYSDEYGLLLVDDAHW